MITAATGFERVPPRFGLLCYVFWGAFLAALVLSSIAFNLGLATEGTDYPTYYRPVAEGLAMGRGISEPDGTSATYPPGYPVYLAVVFRFASILHAETGLMVRVGNAVLSAACALLLFVLMSSAWPQRRSLTGVLLWISYPFGLWLSLSPNSELLFMVVLYSAVYLLWRTSFASDFAPWSYLLIGGLSGLAALVRAGGLGLGCVLAVIALFLCTKLSFRRRALAALLLLAGNLIAILPWQVFLTMSGREDRVRRYGMMAIRDGLTFGVDSKGYRIGKALPPDVAAVMHRFHERGKHWDSPATAAHAFLEESRSSPIAVIKLTLLKAARAWFGTDSGRLETGILLLQIPYLGLILAASVCALRQGGRIARLTLAVWLVAAYFWFMAILALSILRYMIPAIGLLFAILPSLGSSKDGVKVH